MDQHFHPFPGQCSGAKTPTLLPVYSWINVICGKMPPTHFDFVLMVLHNMKTCLCPQPVLKLRHSRWAVSVTSMAFIELLYPPQFVFKLTLKLKNAV